MPKKLDANLEMSAGGIGTRTVKTCFTGEVDTNSRLAAMDWAPVIGDLVGAALEPLYVP